MSRSPNVIASLACLLGATVFAVACGSETDDAAHEAASGSTSEGGGGTMAEADADSDGFSNPDPDSASSGPNQVVAPMPNPEAFWADDPAPMMCLADGSMGAPPNPPGGTPECPDDKNREGCPCDNVGEDAPCWPGLRANRNRGICTDGMTTCEQSFEFGGHWGPCVGFVLPIEGATEGPPTCRCFSKGRWEIDNLAPCFISYTGASDEAETYAVSTWIDDNGMSGCPEEPGTPPPSPQPGKNWSTNRLTVDCAGRFELCYTMRAGNADAPTEDDCVLAETCVETWYPQAGETQELPQLPPWFSTDSACATEFSEGGGYGEMSVKGLSIECDPVDDGQGGRLVFNRVNYCPRICSTNPEAPECANCSMGGAGDF